MVFIGGVDDEDGEDDPDDDVDSREVGFWFFFIRVLFCFFSWVLVGCFFKLTHICLVSI